ncbi:hypothetical protein [Pseudomonas sp. R5(2019)]|uniref:hypothetical protein n=1 Tax=Pseudomonas sp. R5(2019) TaxID=2697566 RepID=UPI001412E0C2|nr:hypothetical protein [Pseudomonas sp. R5(2019)]NBA96691.1 hypothetical protein [Pseudomonas sp. R5(2019)]
MSKSLALLVVLSLTGCATASTTYLNDGKPGLQIDCSGEAMSWESCYDKAQASCAPHSYDIIGTDGTPALKESDKTLGQDVGNYKSRSLVVQCRK